MRFEPDDCQYFNDIVLEGARAPRWTFHGGATTPALSPSGRWLVFEDLKGAIAIHDTTTRTTRTASIKPPPTSHFMVWLRDESAFGLAYDTQGLQLFSPQTGDAAGGLTQGFVPRRAIDLDPATGEPRVAQRWRAEPVRSTRRTVTLPDGAEKRWSFPDLHRTTAVGGATFALWNEASGEPLRVVRDVLTAAPSPSERFVALLRDRCDKPVVCRGTFEIVDVATGSVRSLDLPDVTASSRIVWLGAREHEIAGVLERDARFLRLADDTVLHVEPPTSPDETSPVVWTEGGLVDGSPAELARWAFRPAGRLDGVIEASRLTRAGLFKAFRDGEPLPPQRDRKMP